MTALPWSSLKKVYDALAESFDQFLAARKPVRQPPFLATIETVK
jgi:hypothetical protein